MTWFAISTAVWVFIVVPIVVLWIVGLVDIVRRDAPSEAKAGWVLIVVLLPIVGTIGYFLLRKPTAREIRQAQEACREPGGGRLSDVRRRLPGE